MIDLTDPIATAPGQPNRPEPRRVKTSPGAW